MFKLAILSSHPIQYQAPFFRTISTCGDIDLLVCFKSRGDLYDKGFNREISWDIPLLEGYRYVFAKGLKNFFDIIDSFSPQALLVYGWGGWFNKMVILVAAIKGVPIVMCGENPLVQEKLINSPYRKLKRVGLGLFFKLVGVFLYIGKENRKFYDYVGIPEEKLFFMPYAVENRRFIKSAENIFPKRKKLRDGFGVGEKDAVILFVGKLINKKRPFDLLRAYEKIEAANKSSALHLFFVGEGELRSKLEECAKESGLRNVRFLGFKNQTELPEYYSMADIFVLPSGLGETWGLVVNEAMCFKLPIIVSDVVGCASDLVRPGENGYIFPVGNVSALSDAIKELADNISQRESFGGRSLEIIEGYDYRRDLRGVLAALQSLVF